MQLIDITYNGPIVAPPVLAQYGVWWSNNGNTPTFTTGVWYTYDYSVTVPANGAYKLEMAVDDELEITIKRNGSIVTTHTTNYNNSIASPTAFSVNVTLEAGLHVFSVRGRDTNNANVGFAWSLTNLADGSVVTHSRNKEQPPPAGAPQGPILTPSPYHVIGGREDQFIYQIVKTPNKGYLSLNGTKLNVGDRYSQGDINNGRLKYVHDVIETTTARYVFTDWSFRAIGFDDGLPAATCTNCGIECLPAPEIPRTSDGVYTEKIRIKVYPPPTITKKKDIVLFEGDSYCLTEEDLTIINEDGGEVFFPQNQITVTTTKAPDLGILSPQTFTAGSVTSVCFTAFMTPGDTQWEFQACNPKNKCVTGVINIKVKPFPTPTIWKNGGVHMSCSVADNVYPITNNTWAAGNQYSTSDQIIYSINPPQHGSFNKLSFSQAEIDAGLITYTRDNTGVYDFQITGTICNQKNKCVPLAKQITTSEHPCPPPPECSEMTVRFLDNNDNPNKIIYVDPRTHSFFLNYYLNLSDCDAGTKCFQFSIDLEAGGLEVVSTSDITWNEKLPHGGIENDVCGAQGSIGQLVFRGGEHLCGSTVRVTVKNTHPILSGDYIDVVFVCNTSPPGPPPPPAPPPPGPPSPPPPPPPAPPPQPPPAPEPLDPRDLKNYPSGSTSGNYMHCSQISKKAGGPYKYALTEKEYWDMFLCPKCVTRRDLLYKEFTGTTVSFGGKQECKHYFAILGPYYKNN